MKPFCRAVLSLALLVSVSPLAAENWPAWRGPRGNGISQDEPPTNWSRTENVAWKVPLPGPAGATPVIWEDHIFLTSVEGDDLVLLCIGTDGKPRWKRKVADGNKNVRGDEGNLASPSPSTDGEHVWTFMGNGIVACYDFAGERVWQVDLQERYGRFQIQFGLSSTPVLHGGKLYFQLIHGRQDRTPSRGLVLALDKKTGEEVWKRERATYATIECKHSYASPVLYDDGEQKFLITHGADFAIAHDLEDGRELWRLGGLNPLESYHRTLRFVASPAANEGLIVVPTAKRQKVVAVGPDGEGDITGSESAIRWEIERGTPDVPSPLIHDGIVYLCDEGGRLRAVDAKTGEVLYHERLFSDRYRASPVYADGKIYLTSRRGVISVVQAGRQFKLLAAHEMEEEMSASPAIADDVLYLRTFDHLWAIRKK